MASVCLSCVFKKNIVSVLLMTEGKLVDKRVELIKDEKVLSSSYLSLISAFTTGLNLLNVYVDEHKDIDSVVLECNNSAFIKWVNKGFSKDDYQDYFIKMLEILDKIPLQYSFTYSQKPKALLYASDKYLVGTKQQLKLSGIEDM